MNNTEESEMCQKLPIIEIPILHRGDASWHSYYSLAAVPHSSGWKVFARRQLYKYNIRIWFPFKSDTLSLHYNINNTLGRWTNEIVWSVIPMRGMQWMRQTDVSNR